MRKIFYTLFYGVTLLTLGFSTATAQQVFKTTSPSVISYLEYVPEDYNTNSNKYPVVIFLHGIGERCPNTTDTTVLSQYIQNVAKHGPPKYVKYGAQFPFILISPQLKSNYGDWPSTYVMEVINYCKTYLRIDERRIYLTGLSLGGGGTWWTAQDYPELFAAIAPVCGSRNSTSRACGLAAENLPVWAFHGDKDTTVPLSRSQTMVNAINACLPAPTPLAKLTVYAGVAHNAWDYAYKNDNTLHTPNVYQWLMSYTNTKNAGNNIPLANAGADKTVTTVTTTLAGSGSDSDGTIASYAWTKLKGPSVILGNTSAASLNLSGLLAGDYFFRLTVTDNSGNTDSDYVKVTVQLAAKNALPVCNAGPDQSITLPSNSISATGNGSDSDGSITAYKWTKVSGPTATLLNTTTTTMTASALLQGTYVFRLTVTDDAGAKKYDDMVVTVNPALPVVNAGIDKLVKLPTTSATITGTASDADGTIASYTWTKISGGYCSMYNTTTATLKLSGLASGVYVFRLTATDNMGYTGSDDLTITVDAPPVVNAGPDQTITLPTSSITLYGSATDADGTIVKYQWSKYSGPNFTGGTSTSATYAISKLYEGVYVFKLSVTDNLGAQGMDYVTVTVKGTTVSTSSTSSTGRIATYMSEELAQSTESAPLINESWNFSKVSSEELAKCTMVIFDENGQQLYTGSWSSERNKEILNHRGLYIYNIIREGMRIDTGKIFIREM
jgi:hypothetical protein